MLGLTYSESVVGDTLAASLHWGEMCIPKPVGEVLLGKITSLYCSC